MQQEPLRRHPHLLKRLEEGKHSEAANDEWVSYVIRHYRKREPDVHGRTRYWAYIRAKRKYMRVVVDAEGLILTAFGDRDYTPRQRKRSQ